MTLERRKFFRIQDSVLVKYRVVQHDMLEAERRGVELNRVRIDTARAALFGIETDFQNVCERVRREHPSIVEALELMNRKINLLERLVSADPMMPPSSDTVEHELKSVNISGGGMAIAASTPLAANAKLVIDLVLLPAHEPIRVFGSVVGSRPIEDGEHEVAIEFDQIRDEDREKLIQHVLQRQSESLRRQHDQATA